MAGVWPLAGPIFFSVVGLGLGLGLDDYVTIFLRAFYVSGLWRRIRLPCNGIISGCCSKWKTNIKDSFRFDTSWLYFSK